MIKNKIVKATAFLTLLVMSASKANALSLLEIKQNARENYQEWGVPEYGNYLETIYYELPEPILELIKQRHLHIVIIDKESSVEKIYESLYGDLASGNAAGLALPNILTVFVEGYSHKMTTHIENLGLTNEEYDKLSLRTILVHEIGHLIDIYDNCKITSSEQFINIFNEEKDGFRKTRTFLIDISKAEENIKDEKEYFATALSCYVFYPEDLLEYCPLTYHYINNYLNEVKIENESKSK